MTKSMTENFFMAKKPDHVHRHDPVFIYVKYVFIISWGGAKWTGRLPDSFFMGGEIFIYKGWSWKHVNIY